MPVNSAPTTASDSVSQILEMNNASRLLRRSGYSFSDRGSCIVVDDPVHSSIGGRLVVSGSVPVVLSSEAQTRKFLSDRS